MITNELKKVDHTALKTNQAMIIGLNIIAFVINAPWLAATVTLAMIIGTVRRVPGFSFVYKVLKPMGWPKPDVLLDNPEPHQFAQGFGALVMLFGTIAGYAGFTLLGWAISWVVVVLAALNLFGGFCVGCAVYYWLGRVKMPGFTKTPPENTVPGMRPNVKA